MPRPGRLLHRVDVEETDSANRNTAADLMALLHRMADLEDAGDLSPEELAWVEATEGDITQSAEDMAAEILRGAAVQEMRHGRMRRWWRSCGGRPGRCARAAEAGQVVAAA
jgi:hypothetical protein